MMESGGCKMLRFLLGMGHRLHSLHHHLHCLHLHRHHHFLRHPHPQGRHRRHLHLHLLHCLHHHRRHRHPRLRRLHHPPHRHPRRSSTALQRGKGRTHCQSLVGSATAATATFTGILANLARLAPPAWPRPRSVFQVEASTGWRTISETAGGLPIPGVPSSCRSMAPSPPSCLNP
eukprot:jgi/Botrbrau1/10885/Bobra.0025s0062.1